MRPGSATSLPDSTASTGLLCLSVGAREHHGRSDTEVDHMATTMHILHLVHYNSWHPWMGPTEDTQPELRANARLGCNLSHQVWIVRTSGKGNALSYQRVFPLDPYMHVQAGVARVMIHLGGKDGLG